MAAFDTPLSTLNEAMANSGDPIDAVTSPLPDKLGPTTVASFSPAQTSSLASPRNTVIIHQKSPLLVATPPQVTRALAYSHPFILPLNRLLGLISWSTGDPWESFLFLCSFWATVLYGDVLIVFAGPVVLVVGLMVAMYSRRFSPLSSYSSPAGVKDHRRTSSSAGSSKTGSSKKGSGTVNFSNAARPQKSLDDVIDTLNVLTMRCNTLLEPFLKLTDFLSTQYSATDASTRPQLINLLLRMLGVLPVWLVLSLPPLRLITGRRVVFTVGTLLFTWHSKPARVCRTLLWRSRTVRRVCNILTGLEFPGTAPIEIDGASAGAGSGSGSRRRSQRDAANHLAHSLSASNHSPAGVRFTFTLFENQRRWLGIGWTGALLGYERANWTDEHLNPCPSKDNFTLPKVEEGAHGVWRWTPGSEWTVEPLDVEGERKDKKFAPSSLSVRGKGGGDEGWIYYDNSWSGGKAQDGWGRYTRRRKWVREAELVEVAAAADGEDSGSRNSSSNGGGATELPAGDVPTTAANGRAGSNGSASSLLVSPTTATATTTTSRADEATSDGSIRKRKSLFSRRQSNKSGSKKSAGSGDGSSGGAVAVTPGTSTTTVNTTSSSGGGGGHGQQHGEDRTRRLTDEGEDERSVRKEGWDVGDDVQMSLG